MKRGYSIFPRSKKFRDNFDATFENNTILGGKYPCRECPYWAKTECLYDGDCVALEKESENE
jgi:hypothetical protein